MAVLCGLRQYSIWLEAVRSAICAQAVCFLHSTRPITCLRLSDVCNEVHLNYVKCIIVYTHITLALYRLD